MPLNLHILGSKLLAPRSAETLYRMRLKPLYKEMKNKRLTLVTAGAGYGKTTMVVALGSDTDLQMVWYRLERGDRDPITFLVYLISGIRKYYRDFGKEILKRIGNVKPGGQVWETILARVVMGMENLTGKDLMIVLDDYHELGEDPEINKTVRFLLEHLPPMVHLCIISRTHSGLPVSRLRAAREVVEINGESLAFTPQETELLFSSVFGITINPSIIRGFHEKTGGWISALILLYNSLWGKNQDEISEFLSGLSGPPTAISSYLEENVYSLLPIETRNFLLRTSILSRLNVALCDQILETDRSNKILKSLSQNYLFTFSLDGEEKEYCYHQLFREFLISKLKDELKEDALKALHIKTASILKKRGETDEALEHYMAARQTMEACSLLQDVGMNLLMGGKFLVVKSYLERIPRGEMISRPELLYLNAKLLEVSGRLVEASCEISLALKEFRRIKDRDGVARCLKDLGLYSYFTSDLPGAERRLSELLNDRNVDPRLLVEILGLLTLITSIQGKMNRSDQYAGNAVSLLSRVEGKEAEAALAWIHLNHACRFTLSGDFDKALNLAENTLGYARSAGLAALMPLTFFQISWVDYFTGLFHKGLDAAQKGLEKALESGVEDSQVAWLYHAMALNLLGLGNIKEAEENATRSLRTFQILGNRWGQGVNHRLLHWVHREAGDREPAMSELSNGLGVIEGLALPFLYGGLKADLALYKILEGNLREAWPLLIEAEKVMRQSKFHTAWIHFLKARYFLKKGDEREALDQVEEAVLKCRAGEYHRLVLDEREWVVPLLVGVHSSSPFRDYIERLLKDMGAEAELESMAVDKRGRMAGAAASILKKIKAPAPGLRVNFLGRFRVFQGENEISANRWKGEKPRMLFKHLVFLRNRAYVNKEVLMELLWPEEDASKTIKRLNVALTSLRKTLEPHMKRGIPSSYILRKGDSYMIDLGDGGGVDSDDFENTLELAKNEIESSRGLSLLMDAESLYKGNFLEEDLYEEWCLRERERLKRKYLDLLREIMARLEKKGDLKGALEYGEKYLETDECAEPVYRSLMRYHMVLGDAAMVARTFERCKKNIQVQLGCPVDDKTEHLFREAISTST
jgi:ATP/maltotriose-dependent transcriptional regulator MalT/two-component SAPR family response regulator